MNKQLRILVHIVGSVTFLLMAFISNSNWPDIEKILGQPGGLRALIVQFECLAFFYLNYFLLIEKYYFTGKYFAYLGIVLLFYLLFIPVTRLFVEQLFADFYNSTAGAVTKRQGIRALFFNSRIYVFFLVLVFSFLLKMWEHLKEIRIQKTISELSLLKAQINPHFLFNTLNSIYSLAIQKSNDTPSAILRLASMMRYVLKDTEQNFVQLNREINYIEDYISLQKLRMDKNVVLDYELLGEASNQQIAPLLLIPFIENAFKYGVNAEEASHISIKLIVQEEFLLLEVKNSKVTSTSTLQEATKVGLMNAEKRLRLLYPDRYEMQVLDNKEDYLLKLKLYYNA